MSLTNLKIVQLIPFLVAACCQIGIKLLSAICFELLGCAPGFLPTSAWHPLWIYWNVTHLYSNVFDMGVWCYPESDFIPFSFLN